MDEIRSVTPQGTMDSGAEGWPVRSATTEIGSQASDPVTVHMLDCRRAAWIGRVHRRLDTTFAERGAEGFDLHPLPSETRAKSLNHHCQTQTTPTGLQLQTARRLEYPTVPAVAPGNLQQNGEDGGWEISPNRYW